MYYVCSPELGGNKEYIYIHVKNNIISVWSVLIFSTCWSKLLFKRIITPFGYFEMDSYRLDIPIQILHMVPFSFQDVYLVNI